MARKKRKRKKFVPNAGTKEMNLYLVALGGKVKTSKKIYSRKNKVEIENV